MSSRALGASASWRPRSTAVLLEARRRLPERPRRRSWVIGRSSRWLGFQFATQRTSRQRRSAQVNSILIFDLRLLSSCWSDFAFGLLASFRSGTSQFRSAGATALSVLACCTFWIATGWADGATAPVFASIVGSLHHDTPNALPALCYRARVGPSVNKRRRLTPYSLVNQ